jgi:hypothetical protein
MMPIRKFNVFCSFQSCLVFTAIKFFLFASFGYNFPEPSHMIFRHDLIFGAAEHEYRCRCRDERDFGCRIPFLVTQKRKRAEGWKCVWYQTGEGGKRVFEYQGGYLSRKSQLSKSQKDQKPFQSTTFSEFRLARSIATAPPIDCPYRTFL